MRRSFSQLRKSLYGTQSLQDLILWCQRLPKGFEKFKPGQAKPGNGKPPPAPPPPPKQQGPPPKGLDMKVKIDFPFGSPGTK